MKITGERLNHYIFVIRSHRNIHTGIFMKKVEPIL